MTRPDKPILPTIVVAVLDRADWGTHTDNIVVVDPSRRRLTWVPRDLWSASVGDRINHAFALGGIELLRDALREHGHPVSGALVLRRDATERLLATVTLTVPVDRPLQFLYPLTPTTPDEDGAKLISFDPPAETLDGERLHQWLGARKVPVGAGSDLMRITRQQTALRVALEAGTVLGPVLDDAGSYRLEGPHTLETLGAVDPSWTFATIDDVVPRTIDGKAVLVRDGGMLGALRAIRRALRPAA